MSNGEVQSKSDKKIPQSRKSIIRKGIQRTLTTAKYESIVIHDEIEEEIEWYTLEERQKKIKNWETILLQTFKQSHDSILDELGLSHKKAYGKNALEEKDYRPDQGSSHELDELDTLDALG